MLVMPNRMNAVSATLNGSLMARKLTERVLPEMELGLGP